MGLDSRSRCQRDGAGVKRQEGETVKVRSAFSINSWHRFLPYAEFQCLRPTHLHAVCIYRTKLCSQLCCGDLRYCWLVLITADQYKIQDSVWLRQCKHFEAKGQTVDLTTLTLNKHLKSLWTLFVSILKCTGWFSQSINGKRSILAHNYLHSIYLKKGWLFFTSMYACSLIQLHRQFSILTLFHCCIFKDCKKNVTLNSIANTEQEAQ